MFECDIAHRRSVAVSCVLYMIKCKQIHPVYGALPVRYVTVRVTHGAFSCTSVHLCVSSLPNLAVMHHFYSPLCVSVERSCWACIRRCVTGMFQKQGQCFFIGLAACFLILLLLFSLSLFSLTPKKIHTEKCLVGFAIKWLIQLHDLVSYKATRIVLS